MGLDTLTDTVFPGTGKGDSPRIKLRDWLMGGNNPGGESRSGLSFTQEQANDLLAYTGVGPLLSIYNGVARGADFALTAVQDLASFAANPGEKTRDELGQLGGRLKSIWNNLNPIDRLDFNLGDANSPGSSNIEAINQEVFDAGVEDLLSPTDRDVLDTLSPEDRAQYIKDIKSGKRVDVPFDKNQTPPGQSSDTNQADGEKEKVGGLKGIANFLVPGTRFDPFKEGSSASPQAPQGIGDLLKGLGYDENRTVVNPDGSTATRAEVQAAINKGQDRGKLTKVGIAAGEEILRRFDKNNDGKVQGPEEMAAYNKAMAMDLGPNSAPGTGGIFPNQGGRRQEYGGGNYSPVSGFDNMSNYLFPMALNDAVKRGEDVSSPEGIKSVFDQTFPGGDYNRFKYSSGPGALAYFGLDSLGVDGKPPKSIPDAEIKDKDGNVVDSKDWYHYDTSDGVGVFTEAGYDKWMAANPGKTPPVGVRRGAKGSNKRSGEPSNPGNNLEPGGERNLPPIPRPNNNGECPSGYYGADTNGDGFNDVCIPYQSDIPGAPDNEGLGMGGRKREDASDNLQEAAGKAALDVYNDPTNFMRFQPSALQMIDPRYYNMTSFVPRGEQKDFNFGYKTVPGQQYVNYPETKMAAYGGLMTLADGGSTSYPRMNGQIAGPGTEKSDDIPAMLSDGEFVVNAAAVRGIGNLMGRKKPKSKMDQRREGARTMYALQKAGEQAARMG